MSDNTVKLEILSAPRCKQCANALKRAESVIARLDSSRISLRVVDIVEELDYAVSMGMRAAPAIAINGKLVFTNLPSAIDLEDALRAQIDEHA